MTPERAAIAKLLVERFRHRPRFMQARQVVSVVRRLIKRSHFNARGCLIWEGAKNNDGYGRISVVHLGQRFNFYVHRLAWQLAHDPRDIPYWREIAHKVCDCPPCFHPDHIESQRRRDNRVASAVNTNRRVDPARRRCVTKRRYSFSGAVRAAERLGKSGTVVFPYHCTMCLGWHNTSKAPA